MMVKAGLLIDFGNSETRSIILAGGKAHKLELSNKFAELKPSYVIAKEYENGKTTIFEHGGIYYANGEIVEREFVGLEIRPSAMQNKVEQLSTDLSISLVISKAMKKLSEQYKVGDSELNVEFTVSVLVPPLEQESKSDIMISKIMGLTSLEECLPTTSSYKFNITSVRVQPEGVSAFFGAYFKENFDELEVVEDNEAFGTGYVIVLDIGAGTTDVVIMKDGQLIQSSRDTFKKGGNTVASIIRNEVKKKFGFSPKDIDSVIKTGNLYEGSEVHNVVDTLDGAKDLYSKALMEDLQQYLERMMIDIQEIKGVLCVGGGSLPAMKDDLIVSPAMSSVLLSYITRLAPRIRSVSIGSQNARDVNINGLKLMHKFA